MRYFLYLWGLENSLVQAVDLPEHEDHVVLRAGQGRTMM